MSWRLAKSLETLRAQINAAYPTRSKASDGTIGDAAHASRSSDHNPWVKDGATGVVTALDITHDPANGVDIQKLADTLLASKDSRIKYIICNGRIASGSGQSHPAWQWRPYTGSNQHNRHVHISVKSSKAQYDATGKWAITGDWVAPAPTGVLEPGKALTIREIQTLLTEHGFPTKIDGINGPATKAAVKAFQRAKGLAVDGIAGPVTRAALVAKPVPQPAPPAPSAPAPPPVQPEPFLPAPAPAVGLWASIIAALAAIGRLFSKGH